MTQNAVIHRAPKSRHEWRGKEAPSEQPSTEAPLFRAEIIGGVTFIELIIVITIISILCAISIPQFKKTVDNLEFENFVKDIYYLSRYLQGSAIGEGQIYYLSINKDKGEFSATYRKDNELKNIEGRFGKVYQAPRGIIISTDPPDETGTYFYPDGSIDKIKITFQSQQREISIIIKGAAGGIQIQ